MQVRALVLGVGNTLLSDEGVGVRAVEHMRHTYPDENVEYVDGGTLSFTLAPYIDEADHLIVIDAANLKGSAGDCRCFTGDDMDRFLAQPRRSVHEVNLVDLLNISRLRQALPRRRALFGIQPRNVSWGERLSDPVDRAMRTAADDAWQLLQTWRGA